MKKPKKIYIDESNNMDIYELPSSLGKLLEDISETIELDAAPFSSNLYSGIVITKNGRDYNWHYVESEPKSCAQSIYIPCRDTWEVDNFDIKNYISSVIAEAFFALQARNWKLKEKRKQGAEKTNKNYDSEKRKKAAKKAWAKRKSKGS